MASLKIHAQKAELVIPVTRRVNGYTRFVGKYVTGRRKRFRPPSTDKASTGFTMPLTENLIIISNCPV